MKLIEVSMVIGIIVTIALSCLLEVKSTYDDLQDNVLRMHILANSDSEEDQALKLKVRDELLNNTEAIFGDCSNIDEAETYVQEKLSLIQDLATDVVRDSGYDYSVKAELVNMEFDDRTYDEIVMPAGFYDAIRITIGEAKGHNWWCVMYPPMCIDAVSEDCSNQYFSEEATDILYHNDEYELKLKLLEWLELCNIIPRLKG